MSNNSVFGHRKACVRLTLLNMFGSLSVGNRIRQRYVLSRIGDFHPDGKRILDAGCGSGDYVLALASRFPRNDFIGIDIDETRLARAMDDLRCLGIQADTKFLKGSLTDSLGQDVYDLIYCVDALEHINDDTGVIQNFHDALRPAGTLILHVPLLNQKRYFPWLMNWSQADHVRDGYEKASLFRMMEQIGFTIIETRYTFGPFGALAWDVEETCSAVSRFVRFVFAPIFISLSAMEFFRRNRWGNCILVTAQKAKVNPGVE